MAPEQIKVIIVEDDNDLRDSINEFLTLSGYQVTAVGTGRAFYRALDQENFAVAVIDIGLPDQSGLVLAEYLRTNSATGVIILTARDTAEDQLRGYDAGADLYLTKPVASKVLASAIARLSERVGGKTACTGIVSPTPSAAAWILCRDKWVLLSPESQIIQLTSREFFFLEQLALSADHQVSRDLLASRLYQQQDDYNSRALDALVRRLRNKLARLALQSNPIKNLYGVGYCFSETIILE
jgi:two-component system, OmpR family, response regulator